MIGSLRKTARFLPLLFSLSSFACSEQAATSESAPPAPEAEQDDDRAGTERLIAEADIVQLRDGRLYAMSKSGTVAIVDVSQPGRLALLGKTRLPGQPFEMYLRGNQLVTMSLNAFQSSGAQAEIADEGRYPRYYQNASSAVIVLDISNPTSMSMPAIHVVPGTIDDSRVIGDVLYVVSTERGYCYRCRPDNSTHVTSYSLTDAIGLPKVDDLELAPPEGYGSTWERAVSVGKDRLYVGGRSSTGYSASAGEIDIIDVSDPQGHLVRGAHLEVSGPIYTRWQVDERDGILRVVSQPGASGANNSSKMPAVDTFAIESSQSVKQLGHMEMTIPALEGLRGVRFAEDRAFVITYRRTDPLYTIDLSDPKAPRQRGELHIPGFVFHMEPFGDRLLGLGVDANNEEGNLNVSLFDVSNLDEPRMIERVSFGGKGLRTDDSTARVQLAEDYDRIQKAFKVLDDGLIVVPFSGTTGPRGYGDTCESTTSGVQLIEWQNDRLVKRAHLPLQGNPRRALPYQDELITVSDSNVRTFSLANKDVAQPTADVVIGKCVSRYGYDDFGGFCSVHAPGSRAGGIATIGTLAGVFAFVIVRRRRSSR